MTSAFKESITRAILALPIPARAQLPLLHAMRGVGRRFVKHIERVIWIPTESLTHYCLFNYASRRFVLHGDWDLQKAPILPGLLSNPHFSCIYQMCSEGRPYTETAQFRQMMSEIRAKGRTERRITTEEGVHDYFRQLHRIFDDIRRNGYKSQDDLGGPHDNEIRVSIDRDGMLLKYHNGHHRLAMAKILGIQAVPVCVEFVHRHWFDRSAQQFPGNVVNVICQGLKNLDAAQQAKALGRQQAEAASARSPVAASVPKVPPSTRDPNVSKVVK